MQKLIISGKSGWLETIVPISAITSERAHRLYVARLLRALRASAVPIAGGRHYTWAIG
jgi:hypothetical protein